MSNSYGKKSTIQALETFSTAVTEQLIHSFVSRQHKRQPLKKADNGWTRGKTSKLVPSFPTIFHRGAFIAREKINKEGKCLKKKRQNHMVKRRVV